MCGKRVAALAKSIFSQAEPKRAVTAREFAMQDQPDQVVGTGSRTCVREANRLRICCTPKRLPGHHSSGLLEITSNVGELRLF